MKKNNLTQVESKWKESISKFEDKLSQLQSADTIKNIVESKGKARNGRNSKALFDLNCLAMFYDNPQSFAIILNVPQCFIILDTVFCIVP